MRPAKAVEQAANLICDYFIAKGNCYYQRKTAIEQCEKIYDKYENLDDPEELATMVISGALDLSDIKELTKMYFPKDMEV